MSLIPSYFLDSVAAMGVRGDNGKIEYIGTGFLFGHPAPRQSGQPQSYHVYLVTNRHVVGEGRRLWVRFRTPSGGTPTDPVQVPIREDESVPEHYPWLFHPDDHVDLAVLSLECLAVPHEITDRFLLLDNHAIAREELSTSETSEGNEVFVLGFPLGIAGVSQNEVIVRLGIVARIQDWYDGRSKDFLIDSSIYPGNSGGPVVLKPVFWSARNRPYVRNARLMGLVSSYLPYQEIAVSQQTGRARHVFEENSGLAQVIPTDFIVELTSILEGVYRDFDEGSFVPWEALQSAINAAKPDEGG